MRSCCFLATKSLTTFLSQASVRCSLHCCHWPSNESGAKLYIPTVNICYLEPDSDVMKSTGICTLIKEFIKINHTGHLKDVSQKIQINIVYSNGCLFLQASLLWRVYGYLLRGVFLTDTQKKKVCAYTCMNVTNNNLLCKRAPTFWLPFTIGQVDWH